MREINEVKRMLRTKEYNFLRENSLLGKNLCLLTLGGSKAYGTNIEGSDTDVRGVALNSKKEILLGRDFETIVDTTTDTVVYSFSKIVELLTKANPNTLEIFGMQKEDYFVLTKPGELLIDNIDLFLSQKCAASFGGYANAQLYRLKQKSMHAISDEEYNEHIAKVLNKMKVEFEEKYNTNLEVTLTKSNGIELVGSFNGLNMGQIHEVLNTLNNTYREYKNHSHRNENAFVHDKINKHSMHLIRLYAMGIDLLEEGKIITRRVKDHDLLMSIRHKEFMTSDGGFKEEFFDLVKDYEERFNKALANTCLPKEPNYKEIEELKIAVNESIINGNEVRYERTSNEEKEMLTL